MPPAAADPKDGIFTIGHSTHSAERFVELLKQHGIAAVADVRSIPYSRWNPQFNQETLRAALKENGIDYVFLGKELGARPQDPSCYQHGRVQYSLLAESALFKEGIGRVLDGGRRMRIALMCAEKDPLNCHRTVLVARRLVRAGEAVSHILADGELEPHGKTVERLIKQAGFSGGDLFRTPEDLEDAAYDAREGGIAHAVENPVDGA